LLAQTTATLFGTSPPVRTEGRGVRTVEASTTEPRLDTLMDDPSHLTTNMVVEGAATLLEIRDLSFAIEIGQQGNGGNRKGRFDGAGGGSHLKRRAGGKEWKTLLQHVSCSVRPGEMFAVMGASGAGKSTLLDLIAGRKKDGVQAGQVVLQQQGGRCDGDDSVTASSVSYSSTSSRTLAYITQEDCHVAELTVRETLEFAAALKMGSRARDRQARVEELLADLGLEACADVRVGNSLERGISGGQAKRLSIGVGIVDLESVRALLMDEPTTGLDSAAALGVLYLAKNTLVTRERAVVATVHQPSAEMFSLFDQVCLCV
ncbi:unnamed protein product, partial [Choristocarpus tenellus]